MDLDKYADVIVRCPVPGVADGEQLTIGEFANTEQGQQFLAPALENIKILEQSGIEEEKAFIIALGGAAVTNTEGALMRLEHVATELPKKKLN